MKSLIKKYRKLKNLFLGRYYKARSRSSMKLDKGRLILGDKLIFEVPTIFNGRGVIDIKDGVRFGYIPSNFVGSGDIKIQARKKSAVVEVFEDCIFSGNLSIIANEKITIGKGCLIGDMVMIMDSDFHDLDPLKRHEEGLIAPVEIGENVWLGARVIVLKGVSIGENSVIAAGSVIAKSLPSNVIAGGVPAKVLRRLID